jgi:cobalt-zinc-cadmium efflux system outer membrane protein
VTIETAVSRALATHPTVGAASEAVRAAKGSRRTARSWTNPTFNYSAENAGFPGRVAPVGLDREVMTTAMLPLAPLYQLWPRAARAGAEVRAAEADLRTTRREITLRAVAAFYATASAQVSIDALQEVRTWLDSLVEYTRVRVREGAAAEVDLIRLEVEQGRAEIDLAMARVDFARARAQLSTIVGTDSFRIDPAVVVDTVTRVATLPARDELVALAKAQRPEMQAAEARLAAARSGVAVERSNIVRDVGVMAGLKTMAGTRSFMTGVSLPLPLFDQNRGEIQRADAHRRITAFEREQTARQVAADVSASYAAVQTLSQQVALMQGGLLRRAQDARRIAEGAYREGATSLVQVLDAARALAEARQVYYRALFARQQSVIELKAAIGADDVLAPLTTASTSIPPRQADHASSGSENDR